MTYEFLRLGSWEGGNPGHRGIKKSIAEVSKLWVVTQLLVVT